VSYNLQRRCINALNHITDSAKKAHFGAKKGVFGPFLAYFCLFWPFLASKSVKKREFPTFWPPLLL